MPNTLQDNKYVIVKVWLPPRRQCKRGGLVYYPRLYPQVSAAMFCNLPSCVKMIRWQSRALTHQDPLRTTRPENLQELGIGKQEMTPVSTRGRRWRVRLSSGWDRLSWRKRSWLGERNVVEWHADRSHDVTFQSLRRRWKRKAPLSDVFYVPIPMKLVFSCVCETLCIFKRHPIQLTWLEGIFALFRSSRMESRTQAVTKLC